LRKGRLEKRQRQATKGIKKAGYKRLKVRLEKAQKHPTKRA
jgi:hypothetical protein